MCVISVKDAGFRGDLSKHMHSKQVSAYEKYETRVSVYPQQNLHNGTVKQLKRERPKKLLKSKVPERLIEQMAFSWIPAKTLGQ